MAPAMISFAGTIVFLGIAINMASVFVGLRRALLLSPIRQRVEAQVAIILPITGGASLPEVLQRLDAQTLRTFRLIVAVESEGDPAHAWTLAAMGSVSFPIEIVVAGHATHQAQKCRNQQAALKRLRAGDEIIVLMDGDIRPSAEWLHALVSPVAEGHFGLVTGNRWQQVTAHRLGAHLVATIDRALTINPRLDFAAARVVWGGSLAMSAVKAAAIDLDTSLENTLSDDLSIAERAESCGVRIVTRASLLIASPTRLSLAAAWRFARRQYQICRIYRPYLWWLAALTINMRLAAWIFALLLFNDDGRFGWALLALAGLSMAKQFLVGDIGRRLGLPDPASVRAVQLALGLLQPIPDLFHSTVILAAARTRFVRWGHVTYEVKGPYDIRVRERRAFTV